MKIYGAWYSDDCRLDLYLHREKAIQDAWDYLADVLPEIINSDHKNTYAEFVETGIFEYNGSVVVAIEPYFVDESK